MYRSVEGLENCDIMRYAYAIEYDCIDSLDLYLCRGFFIARSSVYLPRGIQPFNVFIFERGV